MVKIDYLFNNMAKITIQNPNTGFITTIDENQYYQYKKPNINVDWKIISSGTPAPAAPAPVSAPVQQSTQQTPVATNQPASSRLQNIIKTGSINPGGKPNDEYIAALYSEFQNRMPTQAEYDRFKNNYNVKDTANIIAGREIITASTNAPLGERINTTPPEGTIMKSTDSITKPKDTASKDTTRGPAAGEDLLSQVPDDIEIKIYEAFGTFPTEQDAKNYLHNSTLFLRQLDDAIAAKTKIEFDKTKTEEDETTSDILQSIYGTPKQSADVEQWVGNLLGQIFTSVKRKNGILEETYNNHILNTTQLAKYITAVLYGGYTIDDVYRDLKVKELAAQGLTEYEGKTAISEKMKAIDWYKIDEGKSVKNNPVLVPPTDTMEISAELFNNSIFAIPGQAFSTIVEPIDINSEEFKKEAEKIQASYYDIMTKKAEAETEQQKAVADESYRLFQKDLNTKYGIQLSDNANTAWGQLNNLFTGAGEKGLGTSGLLTEAMDKYLMDARKTDQRLREEKISTEEKEEINKLLASGSSKDIHDYVNKIGIERARELGLAPSEDIVNWYKEENLKKLYPDMSDTEIANIKNMMIDDTTGTPIYRSNIYQNLYANRYDLGEQKKTYQEGKLYEQKAADEEKAYKPFTYTNPLSSYTPDGKTDAIISKTDLPYQQKTTLYNPETGKPFQVNPSEVDEYKGWTTAPPKIETPNIDVGSSSTLGERTQKVKNKTTGEIINVYKDSDWWKNNYSVM